MQRNNVRIYRETLMMSKAELARKAGLSALTIDRVESGRPCRLATKRRLLLALGLPVTGRGKLFHSAKSRFVPTESTKRGSHLDEASSL